MEWKQPYSLGTPHPTRGKQWGGVLSHLSHGQVELRTLGAEGVKVVPTQLVRQERAEGKPLAMGACGVYLGSHVP